MLMSQRFHASSRGRDAISGNSPFTNTKPYLVIPLGGGRNCQHALRPIIVITFSNFVISRG